MPTMPTGTPPSLTSAAHDAGASRHVVWVRSHSHSTSPSDDHWPLWLTACHQLASHLQRFGPDAALLDLGTCTDEEAVAVVQALITRLRSNEITLRAAIGPSGILAQLALLHLPHTPTHEPLTLLMAEQIPALLRQLPITALTHLQFADQTNFPLKTLAQVVSTLDSYGIRTIAHLARFVEGALARGETRDAADRVFAAVSAFVGYGFCKSHAAEFARTIYQTAWLKAHYPAHYLAAFLSAQPAGYFPPHVVLEEAKRLRIPVLPVHINASEDRFSVEPAGSLGRGDAPGGNGGSGGKRGRRWGIRIGLRQVSQIGDELAKAILFTRRTFDANGHLHEQPFTTLWDMLTRLRPAGLTRDAAEALVWSGACDGLAPRMERRLWQLRELWPLVDPRPKGTKRRATRAKSATDVRADRPQQLTLSWEMPLEALADVPTLPSLTGFERDALDYQMLGMSSRPHPMRHYRPQLDRRGVLRIADLAHVAEGRLVRVAGWPISAQRPPTAHGVGFVVLEDETGRLPLAMAPALAADLRTILRDARFLIAVGRLERVRWYWALWAFELTDITGGGATRTAHST
jgi:DNA polymerase III alpha subunit